jgi:hypothetical protein
MRLVAAFDPPGALERLRRWRADHAAALRAVPADAVRIDTGRAEGGAFVRVRVDEAYADRFADAG